MFIIQPFSVTDATDWKNLRFSFEVFQKSFRCVMFLHTKKMDHGFWDQGRAFYTLFFSCIFTHASSYCFQLPFRWDENHWPWWPRRSALQQQLYINCSAFFLATAGLLVIAALYDVRRSVKRTVRYRLCEERCPDWNSSWKSRTVRGRHYRTSCPDYRTRSHDYSVNSPSPIQPSSSSTTLDS